MTEEPITEDEETKSRIPTLPTDSVSAMMTAVGAADIYILYDSVAQQLGITDLLVFTTGFFIFLALLRIAERHVTK